MKKKCTNSVCRKSFSYNADSNPIIQCPHCLKKYPRLVFCRSKKAEDVHSLEDNQNKVSIHYIESERAEKMAWIIENKPVCEEDARKKRMSIIRHLREMYAFGEQEFCRLRDAHHMMIRLFETGCIPVVVKTDAETVTVLEEKKIW